MAKNGTEQASKVADQFKEFIPFCMKKLGLDQLPKIEWYKQDEAGNTQPSFGSFQANDQTIRIAINNRHALDIMRTLAHELAHYKQSQSGKLHSRSGETGSPEENEANALAGMIMRDWNRAHPEMFKDEPITETNEPVRIKLRGFQLSPDLDPTMLSKRWINKVDSKTKENPLNPRQRVMPFIVNGQNAVAVFELEPSLKQKGATEIKWFQTHPTNMGVGKLAMKKLQDMAAEDGMSLTLYPWDKGTVSQDKLSEFYKQMGFNELGSSKDLIWEPAKSLRENDYRTFDTRMLDVVVDQLRNNEIERAAPEIPYLIFRQPWLLDRYRDLIVNTINSRRKELIAFALNKYKTLPPEDADYLLSPLFRALENIGIKWEQFAFIKEKLSKDLESEKLNEYKLTHKDPVERWIKTFKNSTHPKFKGKTPEQREKMARAAQLKAVQNKKVFESGFDQEAGIGIDGKTFKFKIRDLVKHAEKYPVKKINPAQFKSQLAGRDEDTDQAAARADKADLKYPIIVVRRPSGKLWIADGTHRVQKSIQQKLSTIDARIIPIDDMEPFRVEQLDESESHFPAMIQDILAAVLDAEEIWFHGSRALGKHKSASDWDILVIIPDSIEGAAYVDAVMALHAVAAKYPHFDIQPAHRSNHIARIASEEGRKLWSSSLAEAWSKKYKKSINCNSPKGFSQRAHCAGRKARSAGKKTKSKSVNESNDPVSDTIKKVSDSFKDGYPFDALEYVLESGLTVNDSVSLKAIFDANMPKIAKMVTDEFRSRSIDTATLSRIRDMLETIGIDVPNSALPSLLYNSSHMMVNTLFSYVNDEQMIDAILIMEELSLWGLDHLSIEDIIDLDDSEAKKDVVRELVRLAKSGGSSYARGVLNHLKRIGVEWPEMVAIERSLSPDLKENLASGKMKYIKPNLDWEWPEAARYPEFQKLGKAGWIEAARKGKAARWSDLGDVGNVDTNLDNLEPAKRERANASMRSNQVELPIVGRWSDGHMDLIAGNTRLATLLDGSHDPLVWVVNVPNGEVTENFADGKGPGKPGDSQRHGIPKGATIAQLEKHAKRPGRAGQLARWQLNMRRGKAKK